MRPFLVLTMIVKDEARGIVKTLDSVRKHLDAYLVLDTGSTDGTQDLIRATMRETMGAVQSAPFIDFAWTRNDALARATFAHQLLHGQPTWLLMLSGDAIVEHPELLREAIERAEREDAIAVRIFVRSEGLHYAQTMLTKAGMGCRYGGVTHEAMVVPEGGKIIDAHPDLCVRYEPGEQDKTARWQLDRDLLENELSGCTPAERKEKTRTIFYLAQTYECLGDNARAEELYEERVRLGGFDEERFISQLRIGRCRWRMKCPPGEVLAAFKAAHKLDPRRAEPLAEAGAYFRDRNQWGASYEMALRASVLPYPKHCALFIESDVYEWRARDMFAVAAYHLGFFDECADACRQLLAGSYLPERERARTQRNLEAAMKNQATAENTAAQ